MLTRCYSIFYKKSSILTTLAISAILLVSCNLPSAIPATTTPSPTATSLPSTDTPTAVPPSPTPNPSATTTLPSTNIVFGPGATAAVEQGTLQPGQVQNFTLSAGKNQPMILLVSSPSNDVTLAVYEANGNMLLDPAKKWSEWQWLLPATQVYTIKVIGGATAGSFTLTAKVAARITFTSGASSATVSGSTPKGFVISYAISANANQTMTVTLNSPANSASLDIFGLAFGQLLLNPSTKATNWTGVLPSTQDYIIEIIPNSGQVVNYSLTVTIN